MLLNYHIRNASNSDVSDMFNIHLYSGKDVWSKDKFEQLIYCNASIKVICNSMSDKVVGFIIYVYFFDEIRVLNIHIDKLYKRIGLGKLLLIDTFIEAKDNLCKYVLLEVRTENKIAINLYHKLGFKILCRREKYYDDMCDAYFMQLTL